MLIGEIPWGGACRRKLRGCSGPQKPRPNKMAPLAGPWSGSVDQVSPFLSRVSQGLQSTSTATHCYIGNECH